MTDEQITKALECCSNASWSGCHDCPYLANLSAFGKNCVALMTEDAIALINRLKQENEELKRDAKYSEEFKKIVEQYNGGKQ